MIRFARACLVCVALLLGLASPSVGLAQNAIGQADMSLTVEAPSPLLSMAVTGGTLSPIPTDGGFTNGQFSVHVDDHRASKDGWYLHASLGDFQRVGGAPTDRFPVDFTVTTVAIDVPGPVGVSGVGISSLVNDERYPVTLASLASTDYNGSSAWALAFGVSGYVGSSSLAEGTYVATFTLSLYSGREP